MAGPRQGRAASLPVEGRARVYERIRYGWLLVVDVGTRERAAEQDGRASAGRLGVSANDGRSDGREVNARLAAMYSTDSSSVCDEGKVYEKCCMWFTSIT